MLKWIKDLCHLDNIKQELTDTRILHNQLKMMVDCLKQEEETLRKEIRELKIQRDTENARRFKSQYPIGKCSLKGNVKINDYDNLIVWEFAKDDTIYRFPVSWEFYALFKSYNSENVSIRGNVICIDEKPNINIRWLTQNRFLIDYNNKSIKRLEDFHIENPDYSELIVNNNYKKYEENKRDNEKKANEQCNCININITNRIEK